MITIYGIHNCDTVKKTRKWFEANGVPYIYHDFRKDGFEPEIALHWCESVDTSLLINKRSTTWKQLSETQKRVIDDSDGSGLVELIIEYPTLIKRPVIESQSEIFIGYNENQLEKLK